MKICYYTAIICDCREHHSKSVKLKLKNDSTICSVKDHLDHQHAVTICYSCETASLEWAVVIHIRFTLLVKNTHKNG